jgi:GNAT superfamily N-acetyltransferase
MIKSYSFQSLRGQSIAPHIEAVASLRIRVFREFPYLYDGHLQDEFDYLGHYASSAGALVLLVWQEGQLVGASTCLPMVEAQAAFQQPFLSPPWVLGKIGYLGESVILAQHRGQGLGREFFARREEHLRSLGCQIATFCAVDRPADHPRRPADYRSLHDFWRRQGYEPQPQCRATFSWRQVDEDAECPNTLTYWTKSLP